MTIMAQFKVKPIIGRIGRHRSDRFTCEQLIVGFYCYPSQTCENRIVAGRDLQDQYLSALMVRPSV